MADDKPGGSDLKTAFVFVKHGDPPPTEWMAAHPGWVKFPATLVPRPAENARPGRASLPVPGAEPGSVESGTARPVSVGAPMVQRPGLRNRGRPPRFPGRFGGEEGQEPREDPVAAYLRVTELLAAMGLVEPVAAWRAKEAQEAPATGVVLASVTASTGVNAGLHVSAEGAEFIFRKETENNLSVTSRTHFPGYFSGVTLGPGYDFKFRSRDQIARDLIQIGIDPDTAKTLSAAGKLDKNTPDRQGKAVDAASEGLHGPAARKFAEQHASDVRLTDRQQNALLVLALPQYEEEVRRKIQVQLNQNEFNALVSFDYSREFTRFSAIADLLNKGRRKEAIDMLEHYDDDKGAGFSIRRVEEAAMMRRPV